MPDFHFAIKLADLWRDAVNAVQVEGHQLALYLVDGQLYCTDDLCTHEATALSNGGRVFAGEVECSAHGARYDIVTGEATEYPAIDPLRTYPVELRGDDVFIAIA
jgi:nitrite reductase/ring-hydroxylating ferredoxin subunit